jgi:L-aspartate oxidase
MYEHRLFTDVLIIGSGIAGAVTALCAADQGVDVTMLTSGRAMDDGNTAYAQGGIVYQSVHPEGENGAKLLEKDVMNAGAHHNFLRAVRFMAKSGPDAVKEILVDRLGVPFSQSGECEWDLTMEGGHSEKRVMHCADFTGRAIMDSLMEAVKSTPNIRLLSNRTAVDLLTAHHHSKKLEYRYQPSNPCLGAYVFNTSLSRVETILADFTVLATGGLGRIYLHTTNSKSTLGSGLTMAHRAGAGIFNAEIVQFHPTALYHKAKRRFLVTEAMRGEGARLVNAAGEAFMSKYHPLADLAPRDIVSRAIVEEMLKTGDDCVFLNAADYVDHDLTTRFPTVYKNCLELGIDITRESIPVVPAAHFHCGGVLADLTGKTTLDRLFAVGECACTGVHGANRLASTSLLEGVLWGKTCGQYVGKRAAGKGKLPKRLKDSIGDWESPGEIRNEDPALTAQDWASIRTTMWNYVGITRTGARLQRAVNDLRNLNKELIHFYKQTPISKSLIDLFHAGHCAYVVSMAALRNRRSIGCHYRVD